MPVTEPFEQERSSSSSSDSGDHGRFLPGTILARRYRIVGLLGKGGMGEVYRADDLKLGQAVALKLLPERLASDPKRLEYFHNEVRLARQVSHPNVCRVHDIGEVDGQHYLSMEYVDGEDLAGLIRRIGRLPPDKAVDVAHQLCAGLAAAHDRGVLHRDLKPANVMLDGRGRVRITDFGLARLTDEKGGTGVAAGTPAYMAPEQLAGQEVTEQSDVYSLGLLLFEVFTGKPAFKADTLAELVRLREDSTPSTPSHIVADIDPAVERVILQCLEKEPRERPKSAFAVSVALPGGDPLAAALAAGETPSPEMVAAAGESGRLDPRVAIVWLAALLLGLVAAAFLADKATVLGRVRQDMKKPGALEDTAREIIRQLGYDTKPTDLAYGFEYDTDYLWSLRTQGSPSSPGEGANRGQRSGMYFWYRQSPGYLIPVARYAWMVSADDPPPTRSEMVGVRLKGNGLLVEFLAVPRKINKKGREPEDAGWERLFVLAGLRQEQFTERSDQDPMGSPPALADRRLAWEGTAQKSENEVRVEAASYHGKPVYFRVFEQCPVPQRMRLGIPPSDRQPIRVESIRFVEWTTMLTVLLGAALVARRSLRLGRSDRKGALRLGLFILSINLLPWLFEASHIPHFAGELALLCSGLRDAVFYAAYFGLIYLAFEPYIRRFWPTLLISWNRLLAGRFRDPSVGRDLLVGAAVGVWFWPVLEFLTVLAPDWLGPVEPFWRTLPSTLLGGRHLVAVSIFCLSSVGLSMAFLLTLLLLRLLLRKWWLWAPAWVLQGTFFFILYDVASLARWLMVAALMTSLLLLYTRLGLLAAIAFFFAAYMLTDFPITADWHARYWDSSLYALTVVAALGVYGFYTSTTGRPLFGDRLARN